MEKRELGKNELLLILNRQNKQVSELLNQRDQFENPDTVEARNVEERLTFKNGGSYILLNLIRYLDGEIELKDVTGN